MRVNLEIGKAILVVEHLQVKNFLDFGLKMWQSGKIELKW